MPRSGARATNSPPSLTGYRLGQAASPRQDPRHPSKRSRIAPRQQNESDVPGYSLTSGRLSWFFVGVRMDVQ